MDVKFDASATEELINQMNNYCAGIMQETRGLMEIMNTSPDWNDNQTKAFKNNIVEISKDLKSALSLESEYMRTYHQRITELRG